MSIFPPRWYAADTVEIIAGTVSESLSNDAFFVGDGAAVMVEIVPSGDSPVTSIVVLDSWNEFVGFAATADLSGAVNNITTYTRIIVSDVLPWIRVKLTPTAGVWTVRLTKIYSRKPPVVAVNLSLSLNGTPSANSGTAVLWTQAGLGAYDSMVINAQLTGNTGGSLDIYLQISSNDLSGGWIDYAHFPQLAAGAPQVRYAITVSRNYGNPSIVPIGANLNPLLAANTLVGGDFASQMLCLAVSNAGTTAAVEQAFVLHLTV